MRMALMEGKGAPRNLALSEVLEEGRVGSRAVTAVGNMVRVSARLTGRVKRVETVAWESQRERVTDEERTRSQAKAETISVERSSDGLAEGRRMVREMTTAALQSACNGEKRDVRPGLGDSRSQAAALSMAVPRTQNDRVVRNVNGKAVSMKTETLGMTVLVNEKTAMVTDAVKVMGAKKTMVVVAMIMVSRKHTTIRPNELVAASVMEATAEGEMKETSTMMKVKM